MATPERIRELKELAAQRKTRATEIAEQNKRTAGDKFTEFAGGTSVGISQMLGLPVDVVNSVLSLANMGHEAPLGGSKSIQAGLAKMGMAPGVGEESDSAFGKAGEFVGAGVIPGVGLPASMAKGVTRRAMRQASHLPRGSTAIDTRGAARTMGEEITKTAVNRPGSYFAAETTGAGLAGAAGKVAEDEGASPGQKLAAEAIVGTVGTLVPAYNAQIANRAVRWGMENLLSMTGPGSEMRAARQLQEGVRDPVEAAARGLAAPDDISPARASGDKMLMSREAKVLADDAIHEAEYREALTNAARRAERSLKDVYGTPQGKQEWEQSVIEQVSAPGAVIKPGFTDEMLDQAADSFSTMYGPIAERKMRLNLVRPSRRTPLKTMLENAPDTKSIMAGPKVRKQVKAWLMNEYAGVTRKVGRRKDTDGYVTAGELIELRSNIRSEARKYTGKDRKRADLLRNAEDKVTEVLNSQLSVEDRSVLRAADRQYRQFKIVDDAARRAGAQTGLTPKSLVSSVGRSQSHRRSVRAKERDLMAAAQAGRPVAEVLSKPREAEIMVRSMTPDQINNKHAEFVETVMNKSRSSDGDIVGTKLKDLLDSNVATAKSLRMSEGDFQRLNTIADEFATIQAKSPKAVNRLMNDGPSTMLELLVVLQSAKGASTISSMRGVGMGGGMVIAQFMTNKARKTLAFLHGDKAEELLRDAFKNKELFNSLLTKNTDPVSRQKEAARVLQSWLLPAGRETAEDLDEDLEDLRREAEEVLQ